MCCNTFPNTFLLPNEQLTLVLTENAAPPNYHHQYLPRTTLAAVVRRHLHHHLVPFDVVLFKKNPKRNLPNGVLLFLAELQAGEYRTLNQIDTHSAHPPQQLISLPHSHQLLRLLFIRLVRLHQILVPVLAAINTLHHHRHVQ